MQDVKEAWNKAYENPEKINDLPWVDTEIPKNILFNFLYRIKAKKGSEKINILDFGCGNGRIGRFLAEECKDNCNIFYYDISENALNYCLSTGIPKDRVIFDISECKKSFDGIIVWGVFHHMDSQLWEYQMELINSLLTPDGLFLFGDFTVNDILFSQERHRQSEVTNIQSYAVDFDFLARSSHILNSGEFRFHENKKFSACREKERCMHYIIAGRSLVDKKEAIIRQKIGRMREKPEFWHFVKYTFKDSLSTPSGNAVKFISESDHEVAQQLWLEGLTLFNRFDSISQDEKVGNKSLSEEMIQNDNKTSFYVYGTQSDQVSIKIEWNNNEDNGFYAIHLYAPLITVNNTDNTFLKTHSFNRFIENIRKTSEDCVLDGFDDKLIGMMREALDEELKNFPGIPSLPVLMMLLMVWPSARFTGKTFIFILPSIFEEMVKGEKMEISAGGLILFFSRLLDEKKTVETSLVPAINSWASIYTTQELAKFTRNKSVGAAIAQVMARNMSHNLGSHVLSNFISDGTYDKIGDKYCLDCLKQYASFSGNDLTAGLFHENANHQAQYFLQYLKSRMDYLSEVTFGISGMLTNRMVFADVMKELDRVRLLLNHISGIGNFKFIFKLAKEEGNEDVLINEVNDFAAAFPNDILGCQAFYNIIENIIRNTAKHHSWVSGADIITFTIRIKESDSGAGCLYCVEIDDGLKKDDIDSLVISLNEKFKESVLDRNNNLRNHSLGLLEMKASAAFLRQISLVDAFSDDTEENDIIKAFNADGALGYRFFLLKPKEFIFVGDDWSLDGNQEDDRQKKLQLLKYAGIEFMKCGEFKSALDSGTAFAHQFLIYDSTLAAEILSKTDYMTLLPLRQILVDDKDMMAVTDMLKRDVNKAIESLKEFSWGKIVKEEKTQDIVAILDHTDQKTFYDQYNFSGLCVENTSSSTQGKYPMFSRYSSSHSSGQSPMQSYLSNIPPYINKEICEAYKSKIIILDERVQSFAEEGVERDIPCWALFETTRVLIPRSPKSDGNGQSTPPMCICDFDGKDIIYTEMSTDDEDVIPLAPQVFTNYKSKLETYIHDNIEDSILIIHYGILERIYGRDNSQIKRKLNLWATGYQNPDDNAGPKKEHARRVIVTSGRGAHSLDLPDTVCFANLSSVLYACTENRNKFILNSLVNQSRRKRQ